MNLRIAKKIRDRMVDGAYYPMHQIFASRRRLTRHGVETDIPIRIRNLEDFAAKGCRFGAGEALKWLRKRGLQKRRP